MWRGCANYAATAKNVRPYLLFLFHPIHCKHAFQSDLHLALVYSLYLIAFIRHLTVHPACHFTFSWRIMTQPTDIQIVWLCVQYSIFVAQNWLTKAHFLFDFQGSTSHCLLTCKGYGRGCRTGHLCTSYLEGWLIYVFDCTLQRHNTESSKQICIPSKGIKQSQSQFSHSCVYERFIFSQNRSAYSAAEK